MADFMSVSAFGINDQLLWLAFYSSMVMFSGPAVAALGYFIASSFARKPTLSVDLETEIRKAA